MFSGGWRLRTESPHPLFKQIRKLTLRESLDERRRERETEGESARPRERQSELSVLQELKLPGPAETTIPFPVQLPLARLSLRFSGLTFRDSCPTRPRPCAVPPKHKDTLGQRAHGDLRHSFGRHTTTPPKRARTPGRSQQLRQSPRPGAREPKASWRGRSYPDSKGLK